MAATSKTGQTADRTGSERLTSLQRSLPFATTSLTADRRPVGESDELDCVRFAEITQLTMLNAYVSNAGNARTIWRGYAMAMGLSVQCRQELNSYLETVDDKCREIATAERDGLGLLPDGWIGWDHFGPIATGATHLRQVPLRQYRTAGAQLGKAVTAHTFTPGTDGEDYTLLADTVAEYCRLDISVIGKQLTALDNLVADARRRIDGLRTANTTTNTAAAVPVGA